MTHKKSLKTLFCKGILIGIFTLFIPGNSISYAEWDNGWPVRVLETDDQTGDWKRLQMAGPFLEQQKGIRALRPGTAIFDNPAVGGQEAHYLYPLWNYYYEEHNLRWDVFSLMTFDKTWYDGKVKSQRFNIFPVYFAQQTDNPDTSYHGVFPVSGNVRNYFGADKISWAFFPVSLQVENEDQKRYSFPWPFIRWQEGATPQTGGGAAWPLVGHFYKQGKYDHQFGGWPFIYSYRDDLDSNTPKLRQAVLPFYALETGPKKDSLTWIWPFFSHIEGKEEPTYVEDQFLWPLVIKARGKERHITQALPFYAYSKLKDREKQWFLWPLMKQTQWNERGLRIDRQQLLFFLVWREKQHSIANPELAPAEKTHVWPLYSYWDNGAGEKQFQFLSPFEVFFPGNRTVREAYTPLFALYRYQEKPNGDLYRGFLFNLIIYESTETHAKFSFGPIFETRKDAEGESFQLFKGLIGYEKKNGKKRLKLLWRNT
ncbi:MAG: hypothetical protein COZ46_00555 [Verrucomicrobia bacterium CG_4_10_14_3_um_filter_43_23]|nr:MAG: hypothetical protein AUJ82_04385 [Verrucomicrobia bacterium CG1_02_43_26]PIP59063.1 MAG: hypothetical protein COX01_05825 [Verrucomicrobia bacterium CG22_combo_CG10-13_8_21_14_all_43_17]PIX59160.1 MAG: hypothetical protein COZ46_00555 [Verrucomicrobia bacterium CG_4_10_14_3_um_filter_43_23]PIY61315.1 MAG: hypothetical protein COY94_05555 [Verrucomicrobia bacterium CG_4_10_14_0_8_um_filter_43_34]PJA44097.1 MAG: hypothetical protein CO175_04270 [Verrucomicrobia bacterium CG_4_9_14_3_um_fi